MKPPPTSRNVAAGFAFKKAPASAPTETRSRKPEDGWEGFLTRKVSPAASPFPPMATPRDPGAHCGLQGGRPLPSPGTFTRLVRVRLGLIKGPVETLAVPAPTAG
jgi:hypothetical protein